MKNIFLKETDKPSYLFIINKSKMFVPEAPYLSYTTVGGKVHKIEGSELYQPQHIYITSDEEIKEGWEGHAYKEDVEGKVFKHFYTTNEWYKDAKKIILTTDQDLINDGVQSINDEFLEWFVKNPSCEEVEIKPLLSNNGRALFGYKIIIPTEEQKQHIIKMMQNDEELGLYGSNIIDTWLEKNGNPEITKQVEREAEELELEEVAKKYYNNFDKRKEEFAFLDGARWQKSRMYSEEDMRLAFEVGRNFQLTGENNFNEILKNENNWKASN